MPAPGCARAAVAKRHVSARERLTLGIEFIPPAIRGARVLRAFPSYNQMEFHKGGTEMSIRTTVLMSAIAAISLGMAQQSSKTELKLASDVAAVLTKQTSIGVYLESRVAKEKVLWPVTSQPVTSETLQAEIERLVKALPKGADWGKLYLPPPPPGKAWKGDEVLAYARAQAQLYGRVGTLEEGTVEILSQKLLPEKSKEVIAALNLKPVYIIALGPGT